MYDLRVSLSNSISITKHDSKITTPSTFTVNESLKQSLHDVLTPFYKKITDYSFLLYHVESIKIKSAHNRISGTDSKNYAEPMGTTELSILYAYVKVSFGIITGFVSRRIRLVSFSCVS